MVITTDNLHVRKHSVWLCFEKFNIRKLNNWKSEIYLKSFWKALKNTCKRMQKVAGKRPFTSLKNELFHRYSLNILSRFPEEDHSESAFTWMGRWSLLKSAQKQTGAGECISHSLKIQFKYCLCFQNDLELLNPFVTLREKCEYGDLRNRSPYSIRIQQNTDQK